MFVLRRPREARAERSKFHDKRNWFSVRLCHYNNSISCCQKLSFARGARPAIDWRPPIDHRMSRVSRHHTRRASAAQRKIPLDMDYRWQRQTKWNGQNDTLVHHHHRRPQRKIESAPRKLYELFFPNFFFSPLMSLRVDLRCSYRPLWWWWWSSNKLNHLCRLGVACLRQVSSEIIRIIFHLSNCLPRTAPNRCLPFIAMCAFGLCWRQRLRNENQQTRRKLVIFRRSLELITTNVRATLFLLLPVPIAIYSAQMYNGSFALSLIRQKEAQFLLVVLIHPLSHCALSTGDLLRWK